MEIQAIATLFVAVGSAVLCICLIVLTLKLIRAVTVLHRTQPIVCARSPSSIHDDSVTCYICVTKPATAVLLQCGHVGLCMDCAAQLMRSTRQCPLCRAAITRAAQVEIVTME